MKEDAKNQQLNRSYEEAFKMLRKKGFSLNEILAIKKAFAAWGREFDENIAFDWKNNTYSSKKKRSHYAFQQEGEVKLFNTLVDLSPNTSSESIIQVMSIALKMLDIESVYAFKVKN